MDSDMEVLRRECGRDWPALVNARKVAKAKRMAIRADLLKSIGDLPPDVDLIACGSLARGEFTERSDIDWSLLIDGAVNPRHVALAKEIEILFDNKGYKKPGPTGTFGNLVFSHDLVHLIGGDTDSNANTTRRILLLIESCSLDHGLVRERVIRAILSRYLEEDTYFKAVPGRKGVIPRFLINDVVRYWRTMAVDYANKVRSRGAKGWALRNLKLRLSRKLIFVSGLLMCLECELDPSLPNRSQGELGLEVDVSNMFPFIEKLSNSVNRTPLDILAAAVRRHTSPESRSEIAEKLFGSYNAFLAKMNDADIRNGLGKLDYHQAQNDTDFNNLRDISRIFQEGLIALFFKSDEKMTALTQEFAVF